MPPVGVPPTIKDDVAKQVHEVKEDLGSKEVPKVDTKEFDSDSTSDGCHSDDTIVNFRTMQVITKKYCHLLWKS